MTKVGVRSSEVGGRKTFLFFVLCLSVFCLLSSVFCLAQQTASEKSISDYDLEGLDKVISIDLRAMDIVDVLKFFAIEGELNIVAGKDVSGEVNLLINDVTIGDALEIVFSTNSLAYEIKGNIIKVMSNNEYKARYGVNFYDQRNTVIHQLKYASAKSLSAMLGNIKSSIGKIIYDDSTGTIVLIDTPAKIAEMEELIDKQELPTVSRVLPTETRVFKLKYAKLEDIQAEISQALTQNIGTMRVDTRTNTLVITDLPHQLEKISELINVFDRKTRQVFIEAKIVQVTLDDTFKWGIDWEKLTTMGYTGDSKSRQFSIKPEVNLPLNLSSSYNKLTLSSLSTSNFSAVLELLQTVGETKILSNPHITTEEGKEATIKVITRQPYREDTTVTSQGGTVTQTINYVFVEVGVMLNVTPTINEDGYISMVIKPEVSSITSWYPDSATSTRVPVIETANAEATVTVADGTSVIIAGMIKDSKTKSINKLPLLGDIPFLGKIFSNVSDVLQRTETIVFLAPRIVSGDETFLLRRHMEKEKMPIRK
ncbi:MAG: secretin N-terminal domain-containing protein [Candidatus Omnitrophota bacterium]